MDKNPNLIQRSKNFVINSLGGSVVTNTDDNKQNENTRVKIGANAYTDNELAKLQTKKIKSFENTDISSIKNFFDNTTTESSKITAKFAKFSILTPEIKKARRILVPSILSPNDLQSDGLSISVKVPELGTDINSKLTEYLNNFFVKDLDLADKLAIWVDNALFEKGAQPVMILPHASISLLANTIDLEKKMVDTQKRFSVGMETLSIETKFDETDVSLEIFKDIDDETIIEIANESLEQFDEKISLESRKEIIKGVKESSKAIKDKVKFTSDYRAIQSPVKKSDKLNKSMIEKINSSIYGGGQDRLYVIPQQDTLSEGEHPTLIPLPAEAVIPIAIPGSKETHIGYFVMVDEWGSVMNRPPVESDCMGTKSSNRIAKVLYNYSKTQLSKENQYTVASSIFGLTVKKMINDKLNDVGIQDGLTVDQHQAIATTLFHRVLDGAKVNMLFVPSNLIGYLAFDYRENGTGKGILEDGEFIISMRNNLMIANVMAGMKNAIDNKTISFDIGDEATNVEQLLKMAHDIFVSKRMFRFGHDPMSISKNIVENSVSVVPKGMKGMPNFEVTSERDSNNVTTPDTEIMENLSKMIVTLTGVPYAALNELGENEFSRSIATTNLFFSNDLRLKQKPVKAMCSKLCRQYVSTSSILLAGIKAIIVDNIGDNKVEFSPEEIVLKVVNSISATLPSPSVSASNAQFEELSKLLDIIDKLVETLYDPDMIVLDEDPDPKDAMTAIASSVRRDMMLNALGELGINNIVSTVTIEDVDQSKLKDVNQLILNFTKSLKDMRQTLLSDNEDI